MQPPLTNLTPGQTGPQVQQLQQWLMALGYLSQSDYNTGPGTYGPKTTAAVAQLQQKLGVDNSTGVGYWGPRTISSVENSFGYSPTATTTTKPTSTTTPTTTTPAATTPSMSPAQAFVSAAQAGAASLAAQGTTGISLAQAIQAAKTDPTILAKYSDAAKLDAQSFGQQLDLLRVATGTEQQNLATQFENERRKLSEAQAAAGTAYSGFRGRAQEQLGQQESGIVQSSRASLQQNLQQLTTAFESKYGTAATNPATAAFTDPSIAGGVSLSGLATPGSGGTTTLAGQTAGGVTGSVPVSKQQDINQTASSYYNVGQIPPMTPLQ